jgi:hypothetical protein
VPQSAANDCQNETPRLRSIRRSRKIRMRLGAGFSFGEDEVAVFDALHRLLVALAPQWRQNYPNNRRPTRATAISEMGQNEPPTSWPAATGPPQMADPPGGGRCFRVGPISDIASLGCFALTKSNAACRCRFRVNRSYRLFFPLSAGRRSFRSASSEKGF